MTSASLSLKTRLGVAVVAAVIFVFLFLQSLAGISAPGSYLSLSKPWHDLPRDLGMAVFAAVAVLSSLPALRHGNRCQQILAALLLLPVLGVFICFIVWVVGTL